MDIQSAAPAGASPIASQQPQPVSPPPTGGPTPTSAYTPPKPPKSHKKLLLLIIIGFLLVTITGGYFYWSKSKKPESAVTSKVEDEKYREGKIISVNFGLYANPKPYQPIPGASSEAERVTKLEEHRSYADNLVNKIYSDLKSEKLTFDQAIEQVNNDPVIGVNTLYKTTIQSGSFTAQDYTERKNLMAEEDVRKVINSIKEGEYSEPFIQKTNFSACNVEDPECKPIIADLRWLIIKVDKIG